MNDVHQRAGLLRADLLDDMLGQPVELAQSVFEQRVDRDLAEEPGSGAVVGRRFSVSVEPVRLPGAGRLLVSGFAVPASSS